MMCIARACHLCVSPAGDPCRQPVLSLLHTRARAAERLDSSTYIWIPQNALFYKRLGHYVHGGWDGFSLLQVD